NLLFVLKDWGKRNGWGVGCIVMNGEENKSDMVVNLGGSCGDELLDKEMGNVVGVICFEGFYFRVHG
uniref:hypothetical protein n=1 Tax=Bacillus subtilis TaxID=1423 RepID=UPI001BDB9C47